MKKQETIEREPAKEQRIDGGYGDSDVYVVESDAGPYVRKVYQPERMHAHLQKHLREDFLRNAVGDFLKPFIPRLKQVTADEVKDVYLEAILEMYESNTLFAKREVEQNEGKYTRHFKDIPQVAKVRFEILPQGSTLRYVESDGKMVLVSEGQKVIPGKNLEQLGGTTGAQERTALGGNTTYPSVFSDPVFVKGLLHTFSVELSRNLISNRDFTKKPFPIFNTIHPANVIPCEESSGNWVFIVTDLSASLGLDCALPIAALAKAYDETSQVYRSPVVGRP